MTTITKRSTAGLAAGALVAGALTFTTFAPTANAAVGSCKAPTTTVSVFGFNDFHGRLSTAPALFTPVEEARAAQGEDNVLLISSGDNIGASVFDSFILDDEPTLEILNAAALDVSTVGNHEFDRGFGDLSGRVNDLSSFPYLAANVYSSGTTVAAPLQEYATYEKGGVTIAVVGVVTTDTPGMVSPDGVSGLTFGDPVEAINRVTTELLDGDAANGEADVVIASLHEGADAGTEWDGIDERVSAILNGHSHSLYSTETSTGIPVLQAASYGEAIARIDLAIDATNGGVCSTTAKVIDLDGAPVGTSARITAIQSIVDETKVAADELGAVVIGDASAAISTPVDGTSNNRNMESPMNNTVAQMFADVLGDGDPEFIGLQNPGGTRDSINAGDITFREAANVLPFANTLMTTQITGAQFKEALEQQWQRYADGTQPSRLDRAFLPLGISDNVSYTYDESLAEGSRITGIWINGQPIDPAKRYTVGSGSFLITGGDNFRALGEGVNTRDTGRADLEAWVEWVADQGTMSPDYSRRGVSAKLATEDLVEGGEGLTFTFGQPLEGGLAPDTLDMNLTAGGEKVSPELFNSTITAYIGDVAVGTGTVTDGFGTVTVSLPDGTTVAEGAQVVRFLVEASGTEIYAPVNVVLVEDIVPDDDNDDVDDPSDGGKGDPKPKPGLPSTGN